MKMRHSVSLCFRSDRTSGRVLIPFDSISKANLEMDFEQELRRAKAN